MKKLFSSLLILELILFVLLLLTEATFLLTLVIMALPIIKIVHFYYVYDIKADTRRHIINVKTSWKKYTFRPKDIKTWKIISHKVQGTEKKTDMSLIIKAILFPNSIKTEINRSFLVLKSTNNKTYYFPYYFTIPTMGVQNKDIKELPKEIEQILGKPPEKKVRLDPGFVGETLLTMEKLYLWVRLNLFFFFC